jgi:NAD(P)-dependent dehydrogenase (short-subunit alcohol dehydrogenase family)
MTTKTALITGSSKGIGFEIARQLAKNGFQVIISGRNESRLSASLAQLQKENEHEHIQMLLMDVSNADSIVKAATIVSNRKIQLDVLINNAAIIEKQDRSLITQDFSTFENTLKTNVYGALQVVRSFLPSMHKPAKIINISSGGGSMTDPVGGWSPAYCVSKSLLNAITRHLAYELASKGISVNAVCPGWVRTDMGGSSASRAVEKGAETPVWLASEAPQELTGKFFRDKQQIDW